MGTTLRFPCDEKSERYCSNLMYSTVRMYYQRNIPIKSFHVGCGILETESLSNVEKCIRYVISSKKSCLEELSMYLIVTPWMCSSNPVVKCVNLRVLDMQYVTTTDSLINNLLSTCSLLEKINLYCCKGLNTVKVKNLPHLRELKFTTQKKVSEILEIESVPSLRLFHFDSEYKRCWYKSLPFDTVTLGRSVTQLHIGHVIFDNEFFELIKSNFPLLESLTLVILYEGSDNYVITNASMKSLTIHLLKWMFTPIRSINIQVYAPNLQCCVYKSSGGSKVPSLSFPITPPGQLKLTMEHGRL